MYEAHNTTINPFFIHKTEEIKLHILAEIEKGKVQRMVFDTYEAVHELPKPIKIKKKNATLDLIIQEVSGYFNVLPEDVKGKSRKGNIMKARIIYCTIARETTKCSFAVIGMEVNKDHATVMNSIKSLKMYSTKILDDTTWSDYLKIKAMFE